MISLIILLVTVVLCMIAGIIYAYIYYTRINPKSRGGRNYTEHNGDDDDKSRRTHIFMFSKA